MKIDMGWEEEAVAWRSMKRDDERERDPLTASARE